MRCRSSVWNVIEAHLFSLSLSPTSSPLVHRSLLLCFVPCDTCVTFHSLSMLFHNLQGGRQLGKLRRDMKTSRAICNYCRISMLLFQIANNIANDNNNNDEKHRKGNYNNSKSNYNCNLQSDAMFVLALWMYSMHSLYSWRVCVPEHEYMCVRVWV